MVVPVGMSIDEQIVSESERVSLAPSGREIDLQIAYDASLGDSARVSTWMIMQLEPAHVAGAEPAYGIGLRLRAGF